MKEIAPGVVTSDVTGYLKLTEEEIELLIRHEPITEFYEVEDSPFARGKFASVKRARCRATGRWFAAKAMRKRRRAQDVRHEIIHEAAILVLARHFHTIVQLHQIYESNSEIILLLELATGGELQRVVDEEQSLEEKSVRLYVGQVLNALKFLHDLNIAHLDIKPQNVLLTDHHPNCEVRLCDFGISRIILGDIEVREVLGTPDYVAPEILQYEPICLATDMWSMGVLAYVLLTGHSPFGGDTKQETFLNISQGEVDFPDELFENVSSEACDFISRLLVVNPEGRLTVHQALRHPWLSGCIASPPPKNSIFCSSVVACLAPPRCPSPDPLITPTKVTTHVSKLEKKLPTFADTIDSKPPETGNTKHGLKNVDSPVKLSKSPANKKRIDNKNIETNDNKSPSTQRISRFTRRSVERLSKPSNSNYTTSNSPTTRSSTAGKRGTDSTDTSPNSGATSASPKARAIKRLAESTERKHERLITPPRPKMAINKENNRNIINSHQREINLTPKSPTTKSSFSSPSPTSYHRKTRLEPPPGSTSARREEYMKKVGMGKLSGDITKRSTNKSKDMRLSPMCLRRESSKCEPLPSNESSIGPRLMVDKGVC